MEPDNQIQKAKRSVQCSAFQTVASMKAKATLKEPARESIQRWKEAHHEHSLHGHSSVVKIPLDARRHTLNDRLDTNVENLDASIVALESDAHKKEVCARIVILRSLVNISLALQQEAGYLVNNARVVDVAARQLEHI